MTEKVKTVIECYFRLTDFEFRGHPSDGLFAGRPSIYFYQFCLSHGNTRIGSEMMTNKKWLINHGSWFLRWSAGLWRVRTSWDMHGTRLILSQFQTICTKTCFETFENKVVDPYLELWTEFNFCNTYFVTLSNSKSVTKSSQYVTWPRFNWYYMIWYDQNTIWSRTKIATALEMLHMWHMSHFVEHGPVW